MMIIPKQEYTTGFKGLAVKRYKEARSISGVAKDLGLVELIIGVRVNNRGQSNIIYTKKGRATTKENRHPPINATLTP